MSSAKDGQQTRQESQDPSGKVTGSYSIVDAQGITRQVEYWADDSGFHAVLTLFISLPYLTLHHNVFFSLQEIKSNEPGLEQAQLGSASISKL